MLQELSYRKRTPSVDILTMKCVASCNTIITKSDPKTTIGHLFAMFKNITLPKGYGVTRESLKSLYDHSFDGDVDFAALGAIAEILSNGIILSHWGDAHTIDDETSVIAAPIEINNERNYAVLISGKKKTGFKYPYAMRVFSDTYIKDELLNIYRTSPQGVATSRQNADFQKSAANLLINYILNNSDLSFLTTNDENNGTGSQNANNDNQENINCNRIMNKKLIRLTESDLHRIVKESVKRVLRESAYPRIRINKSFEDGLDEIEWLSQYVNDGDVFTAGRTEDGAVLKVKFDYIEMALQDGDADELSIEFSNGYIEENPIGFIKEIRHFMSNGNNFENALRKCIYADSR